MYLFSDLFVDRVGPVNGVKETEIGDKNQAQSSGLNFGELLAEAQRNKEDAEKKVEVNQPTPQQQQADEARMSMASSFAILNSFLREKNLKKKEENRGR